MLVIFVVFARKVVANCPTYMIGDLLLSTRVSFIPGCNQGPREPKVRLHSPIRYAVGKIDYGEREARMVWMVCVGIGVKGGSFTATSIQGNRTEADADRVSAVKKLEGDIIH